MRNQNKIKFKINNLKNCNPTHTGRSFSHLEHVNVHKIQGANQRPFFKNIKLTTIRMVDKPGIYFT